MQNTLLLLILRREVLLLFVLVTFELVSKSYEGSVVRLVWVSQIFC